MKQKSVCGALEFSEFIKQNVSEAEYFRHFLVDAKEFMLKFKWCKDIRASYVGGGVGGIYAVFLFEIDNLASPVDDKLWTIIGDIPPAYLVVNDGPQDPRSALQVYVELMMEWVAAVKSGKPIDGLIPVNVEPTGGYAEMLESRLSYIRDNFL